MKITKSNKNALRLLLVSLTGPICLLTNIEAVAQPEGGELLREVERETRPKLPAPPVPEAVPQPPVTREGPEVPVERFVFEGNTLLSDAELARVVAPWTSKKLTMAELQFIADVVAERYRQAGYLVRAFLPQQNVNAGTIRIVVVEARLGEVKVEEGKAQGLRVSQKFAERSIRRRQRSGDVLDLSGLERGAQLLDETPGVSAKTVLVAGGQPGFTDVVVQVEDEPLVGGSVTVDNFGSRSTGAERISAVVSLDNPSGGGDQAQLYSQLSDGSRYARLRYSAPLGHDGIRAGLNVSHYQYELGKEFKALDAEGDATAWGADVLYPIRRERMSNMNVLGRMELRSYDNSQLGEETSNKDVSSLTIGLFGDVADAWHGGGFNVYSATLVVGELDLSGNGTDLANDQLSAQRDGSYQKLAWSLGRLQKLTDDTTLWATVQGQFAGNNLDSSEGFSLGGPTGVRAYPILEGSGDEGWLAALELRHRLAATWTALVFYDYGRVRQHKDPWLGWNAADPSQSLSYSLEGAGVGAVWNGARGFQVSLTAARRFGSNPLGRPDTGKDSDGSLESTRLWISASHFF